MDVPEFLRSIPTDERTCTYTIHVARSLYEERRRALLDEFRIKEIQRRVADKILGRKSTDVDLVFFKRDSTAIEDMSEVLSSEFCESEEETDHQMRRSNAEDVSGRVKKPRGVARFLDIEAEEDGSDEYQGEDGDEEYLNDPTFIANDEEEFEAPVEKHNQDMFEMNRNMLKRLRKRFSRKRSRGLFDLAMHEEPVALESEEEASDDVQDEIKNIDVEFVFSERDDVEYATEAKQPVFESGAVDFSCNLKTAEKKLNDAKKGWMFDRRD